MKMREGKRRDTDFEKSLVELLPNQLFFGCIPRPETTFDKIEKLCKDSCYINISNKFHYEPFYEDFGPWNLSVLYRLTDQIDKLVEIEEKRGRRLVVYVQEDGSGQYEKIKVNLAYVLGAYLIIYQGFTADDAYLTVSSKENVQFIGFRDASMGAPQYLLHIHDVLRGIEQGLKLGWLDFTSFDYKEYEYYERVENGDLNWIIPGKILSFCGPHNESREENGYPYHAPDVYFDYFREKNVSTIVRLNAKNYDASKFTKAGFQHVDLFFVDGSTPSDEIMMKFIELVDAAKGGVAVHCKAGLGRTGTLIACWMMKEYGLTAGECMGWLRVCRPGSVIGPQQTYLLEKQKMCWAMSPCNGVHLGMSRTIDVEAVNARERNVRKLTNQVDEIKLGEKEKEKTRPNILRRKVMVLNSKPSSTSTSSPSSQKSKIPDETSIDAQGRSQGDRLLQLKAKHQHEADQHPGTSNRYVKRVSPHIQVPSQAFLNRNREPAASSRTPSDKRTVKTSPNGTIAYRTRNSTGAGAAGLTRTPASAVFPSMALRRSEATRYLSPTTPIKPMSPAIEDSNETRYKPRLRSDRPIGSTTMTPQFGLVRVPIEPTYPNATRTPLTPRNYSTTSQRHPSTSSRFGGDQKPMMTRASASTSALTRSCVRK